MKNKQINCSICDGLMDDDILHTHNAEPVAVDRCCWDCNEYVVLPARRLSSFQQRNADGKTIEAGGQPR